MSSYGDWPPTSHPQFDDEAAPRSVVKFPVPQPSQRQQRSADPSASMPPATSSVTPLQGRRQSATPSRSRRRESTSRQRRSPRRTSRLAASSSAFSAQSTRQRTRQVPPSRPPSAQRRPKPRRPSRPPGLLIYLARLLILGIGVAGIAGTVLSVWNPALHVENPNENAPSIRQSAIGSSTATEGSAPIPREIALSLGQELTDLKAQLEGIEAQVPGLTLSTFLYDLETQEYLNLNGGAPVSAASVIKVPILVAFLQAVDQGEVRLDEPLAIAADQIASGSGDMQMEPPGTIYTALETASWMIINSDNTATNMLIDRLGGAEKLNELFRSWGLEDTVIRNPLPDLDGTNTTSPEDLVSLLTLIDRGELLSLRSRDRMFAIMQRTYTDSLLPRGLGEGAIISHKTGDIGSLLGDAGIVDLPNGKRYVLAVLVQRPHNDGRAHELIHLVSQLAYSELSTPLQPDPINSPAEAEVQSPPAE